MGRRTRLPTWRWEGEKGKGSDSGSWYGRSFQGSRKGAIGKGGKGKGVNETSEEQPDSSEKQLGGIDFGGSLEKGSL